jgi:hypothetical protein
MRKVLPLRTKSNELYSEFSKIHIYFEFFVNKTLILLASDWLTGAAVADVAAG